jgi:ketosteroid isomerase-like protein
LEEQTVSQENVEIVRQIYGELNSGRAFPPQLFADDFVADLSGVSLDTRELYGVDQTERALASYFGTFDDFHVTADVVYTDTHRVITAIRDGGRIAGSDAEVWNHYIHVWTLRDGRVVHLSSHTERPEAFKAAGLEE